MFYSTIRLVLIGALVLFKLGKSDDTPARAVVEEKFYGFIMGQSVPVVPSQIKSQCFYGLGVNNCAIQNLESLELVENNIDYLIKLKDVKEPTLEYDGYCLQWPYTVSYANGEKIQWDIFCDPITANDVNLFGYEVRFAANRWDGDLGVVSCPLKREGCTYDDQGRMGGCMSSKTKYLYGYNLTLNVKFLTDGEDLWRSVHSCETLVLEGDTPPDTLWEHITIINVTTTAKYSLASSAIAWIFFASLGVALLLLRLCRKDLCVVCNRRLWLARKQCFFCLFVEARQPPLSLMYMIKIREEQKEDWHKGPDDEWVEEMKEKRERPFTARTKEVIVSRSQSSKRLLKSLTSSHKIAVASPPPKIDGSLPNAIAPSSATIESKKEIRLVYPTAKSQVSGRTAKPLSRRDTSRRPPLQPSRAQGGSGKPVQPLAMRSRAQQKSVTTRQSVRKTKKRTGGL